MDRKALGCCIQYHNRGARSPSRQPDALTVLGQDVIRPLAEGCKKFAAAVAAETERTSYWLKPSALGLSAQPFTNSWRTRYKFGLFVSLSLCLTLQVLRLASLGVCFLKVSENAPAFLVFVFFPCLAYSDLHRRALVLTYTARCGGYIDGEGTCALF